MIRKENLKALEEIKDIKGITITRLINLAIKENSNNQELISILEEVKGYFQPSQPTDCGNNRSSVVHGYMHSSVWNKDSFEKLIHDIAKISKFAGF